MTSFTLATTPKFGRPSPRIKRGARGTLLENFLEPAGRALPKPQVLVEAASRRMNLYNNYESVPVSLRPAASMAEESTQARPLEYTGMIIRSPGAPAGYRSTEPRSFPRPHPFTATIISMKSPVLRNRKRLTFRTNAPRGGLSHHLGATLGPRQRNVRKIY